MYLYIYMNWVSSMVSNNFSLQTNQSTIFFQCMFSLYRYECLLVKYEPFSIVKQYAWILNIQMHDLPQSIICFTICAGVFHAVLNLPCNYCKFPPLGNKHFYSILKCEDN